jgi:hypothetical protein
LCFTKSNVDNGVINVFGAGCIYIVLSIKFSGGVKIINKRMNVVVCWSSTIDISVKNFLF